MIFVTTSQRGYTDSELHGPFNSIDEGKSKVTDGMTRGYDGDETRFTFFSVTPTGSTELGYVLFRDEVEGFLDDDLKEEHFPNT
tara:strand:- start:1926 stop:2177 length:252 start_codon:yes stop_codon:yes gene_type:complete